MARSESNGIIELCDGDVRRNQGSSLIARQIELENMKARQFKAKEKVNEKNLSLRQEQKTNQYLDKIHREHFQVEQWQGNFKKQQMRENIQESLRMREAKDKELADSLITKEAQINKLFKPSPSKALNIHGDSVKKIGQKHLVDMHMGGAE